MRQTGDVVRMMENDSKKEVGLVVGEGDPKKNDEEEEVQYQNDFDESNAVTKREVGKKEEDEERYDDCEWKASQQQRY